MEKYAESNKERTGYRNGQLIYPISVVDHKKESQGGGGSGQPGPNTVGTEEIIDNSILMEDLNQSVKDDMITKEDRVTEQELDNFDV